MAIHPLDLHFRLSPKFDAPKLNEILCLILDIMQFDEDMHYELAVEKNAGEGSSVEIRREALGRHLNAESWPDIHQIRFSNRWIKGMNVKINVVKREGYSVLELKGGFEDLDLRERVSSEVAARLDLLLLAEFQIHPNLQEHERIFGSWLLAPSVAGQALPHFANGNFGKALAAAYEVYAGMVRRVLRSAPPGTGRLEEMLDQEPPPLLFPELAGEPLRLELRGLGRLMAGMQSLMEPVLKQPERVPKEPAPVLKYLVLLSMLVERLETAVPNPAFKVKAKSAMPARPRSAKPARPAKAKRRRVGSKKPAPGRRARRSAGAGSASGRQARKTRKT